MGMENIEHLVVVMFENRSFDNLLGWLYDNEANPPKFNIPPQNPPTFNGLTVDTYFNLIDPNSQKKVYAARPPTSWPSCPNPNQVPTPDPHETFEHVSAQIFGKQDPTPADQANMSGFLQDYATTDAGVASAEQIMQTHGPNEANVINDIARSFAVCDAWFASVPSQTWPNRGFVHTGSSDGHVDNDLYEWYHIPTIFNVLHDQGRSVGIFSDATIKIIPSLTFWQLPYLGPFRDNIYDISNFAARCSVQPGASADLKLPTYSFVEPRFTSEFLGLKQPNDYHPPHNICRGEQFLAELYGAIRSSPYRDKIMFVILFDEHGGCYDHVPPPGGAAPPIPCPLSRDGKFQYDRFGVRIPAIVVSSYVEPGTVFRASLGEPPYDHTSILATLRDWLGLAADPAKFLPSPRIAAAPTLQRVLTRAVGNENKDWPDIVAKCTIDGSDVSENTPLNDVQKSLIAGARVLNSGEDHVVATQQAKQLHTYAHGAQQLALPPRRA